MNSTAYAINLGCRLSASINFVHCCKKSMSASSPKRRKVAGAAASSTNPKSGKSDQPVPDEVGSLQSLEARRLKLLDDLKIVERQIYTLEESYIEETQSLGNVIRGWEGFANASLPRGTGTAVFNRRARVLNSDRIFSASSTTSPLQVQSDLDE